MQSENRKLRPNPRRAAGIVLALSLVATLFAFWREHELVHKNQIIRWQDSLAQLQPILRPLLSDRFMSLNGQAKQTLRAEGFSQQAWDRFLQLSDWRDRFAGMVEIGYAEFSRDKCVVKYSTGRNGQPFHPPGFDLMGDPAIRQTIETSADTGVSSATPPIHFGRLKTSLSLLSMPAKDKAPASPAENRSNLRGFTFFAVDQQEYFRSVEEQLKNLPLGIRLLEPGEPTPPRTETERWFTNGGLSGEWRFVATMKPPPLTDRAAQWFVLALGMLLSALLYSLFLKQAKLQILAEAANAQILHRDAEITAMNHDLEKKIAHRTAQLNESLAAERELNRLKSNFISMVTHEIRTPLALILGSSEILSRYLDRLPAEKRTEHLRTIDSAVHRMAALLEDVLFFSKAEAGKMEFNPTELNIETFCQQMVDELHSATNRRCPIELSVKDCADPARADENLLRHILSNIITNAVKYSPAGTPVKFSITRSDGEAIFVVQDRGIGIPEEDQRRLFTPFHRSKKVATMQGTGLGLVIVKHCVERHGGTIEIESVENCGTSVRLRLPLFSPSHTEFIKRISTPDNK